MQTAERPLTVAHVDAETGFSGGEVQVFLLLEGLRRAGHRSVLLCPPQPLEQEEHLHLAAREAGLGVDVRDGQGALGGLHRASG